MRITVFIKQGATNTSFATTATTIGKLFSDKDFFEDYNVPSGAHPTIDGERVTDGTTIRNGTEISWDRPVADKG